MNQPVRMPDTEAQRAAMGRLGFLVGRWIGEARVYRGSAEPQTLKQTEAVEYKLDGLVLMIEGVGRDKSTGKPALQALGVISYDDETRAYRMRAFNDGRYLETEVKLAESGEEMTWGFELGEIKTSSVLRMDEAGNWTEQHEISIGYQPPRKFMEVVVRPQK